MSDPNQATSSELDISVVVMAYNEVANLTPVVHELVGELQRLGLRWELVIVDDGSTDGTSQVADQMACETAGVNVIHHGTNQGLGGVYITGFAATRGRFVTFFPADGEFPATIIGQFVPLLENTDMVLGYLQNPDISAFSRLLAGSERAMYRILFGPLPKFQGIAMFRRSLLDAFELGSTGRAGTVMLELIIRTSRANYRLVSVPTELRPRMSGESKVNNLPTIWHNFIQMLALRWRL
jgi:glycosyltransferase involved in cell wall biosynthesis